MTRTAVLVLVILLCNLGARWGLIEFAGSHSPYWDEWEGIGVVVLKPAAEHDLNATDLFEPHNEHRIVWTRVLSLLLFGLNGNEWNPVLEMSVGAVIYSVGAALLFLMVGYRRPPRTQVVLTFFLLILTVPSFAWENTLSGFQTQFTFCIVFSLLALWAFHAGQESWRGPVLGWVFALMAGLSFSAGLLTLPAMFCFSVWWIVRGNGGRNRWVAAIGSCLAMAVGLALVPGVSSHDSIMASGVSDFLTTFLRCLSWPYAWVVFPAVLIYAPVILLGLQSWRERTKPAERSFLVLMVGVWTLIVAAAIAYGRSNGGSGPSPRYVDLLIPGVFINLVALTELHWPRYLADRVPRMTTVYGTLVLAGLVLVSVVNLAPDLRERRRQAEAWEQNISGFLVSGDTGRLRNADQADIPFPSARIDDLVSFLSDPVLKEMLPTELTGRGPKPRLSQTVDGIRALWWLFLSAGLVLLSRQVAMDWTLGRRRLESD